MVWGPVQVDYLLCEGKPLHGQVVLHPGQVLGLGDDSTASLDPPPQDNLGARRGQGCRQENMGI